MPFRVIDTICCPAYFIIHFLSSIHKKQVESITTSKYFSHKSIGCHFTCQIFVLASKVIFVILLTLIWMNVTARCALHSSFFRIYHILLQMDGSQNDQGNHPSCCRWHKSKVQPVAPRVSLRQPTGVPAQLVWASWMPYSRSRTNNMGYACSFGRNFTIPRT